MHMSNFWLFDWNIHTHSTLLFMTSYC